MTAKVLSDGHGISESSPFWSQVTHSFGPINWQIGAIDIGRSLVFEVLKPRVARFLYLISGITYLGACNVIPYLGKAGLISKIEKASDAILAGLKVEVLNKAKS